MNRPPCRGPRSIREKSHAKNYRRECATIRVNRFGVTFARMFPAPLNALGLLDSSRLLPGKPAEGKDAVFSIHPLEGWSDLRALCISRWGPVILPAQRPVCRQ